MKYIALVLAGWLSLTVSSPAAIKREPADILRQSQEAFEARDYGKAAQLLGDAIEQNPKLAPAYILRGLAYSALDKFDEAIADFSKAAEILPSDERPLILRAAVHQQKRDWDKAIADFTQALNRKPDDAETLCNRGICYGAKELDDKAFADFDAAVKVAPENIHARQLRGSAYGEKGDKDKALADFQQAIKIDPNSPVTYLYRAHLYLLESQPELALVDLEEVMRRAPDFSGAANDYAWTLATNPKDGVRDGRKAVEYAKKACHETDYKHAPTLDTLAAAHAEAGDWDAAVKWQMEALRLAEQSNPDDVDGMKERLALFKDKKPYREDPKKEKEKKQKP